MVGRARGKLAGKTAELLAVVSGLVLMDAGAARAADVLTQRNDNGRSGVNAAETTLTPATVGPGTFGRLWTVYTDSHVIAQPLYVSKLAIDTSANAGGAPIVKGTFNTLIVATMHNTVYAYDADHENRLPDGKTKPLWATWLGAPRAGGKDIDMFSTNDPEWGITSTPVIDAQKSTIWVLAWRTENNHPVYRLHKMNLKNGSVTSSVQVGGPPADPNKPCAYADGFNPCTQKQRTGLLLLNGVIYMAFGGDGNRGNVLAYDANTLQQKAFWASTPHGTNGGIWQSGHGLVADAGSNIYLMTGNGSFDAAQGNYGDSFVKLHLENGKLVVKDYFTPCNQKRLNDIDLDLGSSGPVLVPNSNVLIGGGKQGIIYVVSRTNMGKFQAGPASGGMDCLNANIPQQLQATQFTVENGVTDYGNIHSSPVYFKAADKARVYVWGEFNHLRAFGFDGGKFSADAPKQSVYVPPDGMPGGMLGVSSNGAKNGIVWGVVPLNGDANKFRGVQGIVVAVDAQDVSKQLWTSEQAGGRDRLGLFAAFVPPTIAGGKVFVATHGDTEALHLYGGAERPSAAQLPQRHYIAVYGLLTGGKPVVNQDSDDITVVKASAAGAVTLDLATCATGAGGTLDCTAALAKKAGAPAFHAVTVPAGFNFAGCNLLRVTTASKAGAANDATGVGWYAADATAGSLSADEGRLVLRGQLKQVGTAKFKSGDQAVLHEFAGLANCSAAGSASLDKLFKPFMQFDNAPESVFHNWDRSANYRVSRAAPAFDRSGEVLNP